MGESLLIEAMPGEIRAAAVKDARVVDLFIERRGRESLVGNIYLGRVERVVDGVDAAFVDIGLGRSGFLALRDARSGDRPARDSGGPTGSRIVEGEAIRVQVAKDSAGSKGVQLDRRIALAGRYLVYTPGRERVAVSRQITGPEERARLETLVRAAAEDGEGFIVRTAAEEADGSEIAADAAFLRRTWSGIEAASVSAPPPALLHEEPPPLFRLLRDRAGDETEEIVIDSPGSFAAARDYCRSFLPALESRLRLYTEPEPLFAAADVEAEIERALAPRVGLRSGGELVIEATEALTAIDVNSGRYSGGNRLEETALRTNLEAANEAARQIRLRNIGGLIIIDFIHMRDRSGWERVMDTLGDALAGDRTNVRLNGRPGSGPVEITRRRQRESLEWMHTEPCAHCGGRGRVTTPQSAALRVMRAIRREARLARPGPMVVTAGNEVVDSLENEASSAMSELAAIVGRRITLRRSPSYGRETFDIVADTD